MPATYPPIVPDDIVIDDAFYRNAATAAVRSWCGWHVAPVLEETITLDGSGARHLLLPSLRVVDVIEISTRVGGVIDPSRYFLSKRAGIMQVELAGTIWPNSVGSVTVKMTHGFELDDVPDVQAIIESISQRAATQPAGIVAQSVGSASVQYARDNASGSTLSTPLLRSEMGALARYRLSQGV